MKEKIKLFRCHYCTNGSPKEEMIQIIDKRKTKQGGNIYRYYHEECLTVHKQNKLNNEKRTCAFSNESKIHNKLKCDIFKKLIKSKLSLIDQFGEIVVVDKDSFIAIESPVIVEFINKVPVYDSSTCDVCFSKFDLQEYNNDRLRERTGYKNCNIKDNYFNIHPCIKCPFNKNTYKHIFDIGIAINNKYTDVIEILHTTKCKPSKIKYCIQNKINLYEIKSDVNLNNSEIQCTRIWWENQNGKIEIAEEYK